MTKMNTHNARNINQVADKKTMQSFFEYLNAKDKNIAQMAFFIATKGNDGTFIQTLYVAMILTTFSMFILEQDASTHEKMMSMEYVPIEDLLELGLIKSELEFFKTS